MAKVPEQPKHDAASPPDPTSEGESADVIIADGGGVSDAFDVMVLSSDDLSPDANNEVVVSGVEGLSITILADEDVSEQGVSAEHTTLTGIDVEGLEFVSFSSGLKVYYDRASVKVKK
jgi:hypothetical protein